MTSQYVDRGAPIEGIERTARDSRVPFNFPRDIANFYLPDKRAKRRTGFKELTNVVRTQALAKATGSTIEAKFEEDEFFKHSLLKTPLSYGMIRWNEDYQIRTTKEFTIEFMLRMGNKERLVVDPYSRRARRHTGTPDWAAGTDGGVLRQPGVYVLDQMLLSNDHEFNDGRIASPGNTFQLSTLLANWQFDVFPLITMAFGYTETSIFCEMGLVEGTGLNQGLYWPREILLSHSISAYTVGDIHHIALTFDPNLGSFGRLSFLVDGVVRDTHDLPNADVRFIGEYDEINGIIHNTGQLRDIVVLNEATARASYSSACAMRQDMHAHQTFYQDYVNNVDEDPVPWCLSPPKGTALWDLRIWQEARTTVEIDSLKNKRVLPSDSGLANLKGNWWLNDGGPICINRAGAEERYLTVHHGYPGYVDNEDMLHKLGIMLADGQHVIKSFNKDDRLLGSGLHSKLCAVFEEDTRGDPGAEEYLRYQDKHSFTVQAQVLLPSGWNAEINDNTTFPLSADTVNDAHNRRFLNLNTYILQDGSLDNVNLARRQAIKHATNIPSNYVDQYARAYDMTIWSIEGTQQFNTSEKKLNEPDRRRIPLARGLIDTTGHVIFEVYKRQGNGEPPLLYRLRSNSVLPAGSVTTLSFRIKPEWSVSSDQVDCTGWTMELYFTDIGSGVTTLEATFTENRPDGTVVNLETLSPRSSFIAHEKNYDIILGASYVNDGWDWSVQAPFIGTIGATSEPDRGNSGPWPVQQRFMTPYQDQPAHLVIGFFRLWSNSLTKDELAEAAVSSLVDKEQSIDLLINLEIDQITGNRIGSSTRYPDVFLTGYKSWGMPQGFRDHRFDASSATGIFLKTEYIRGAWANEDGLGYIKIDSSAYNSRQQNTKVTGIHEFRDTLDQSFGLIVGYDDALVLNRQINANQDNLLIQAHGMLSEFSPGRDIKGLAVGDRTILTHKGALPKVYNGKTMTTAGFKRWSGGVPQVVEATGGSMTSSKWYGIVVVYESEEWGIQHISPRVNIQLSGTGTAINIFNVSAHYDPRVSVMKIYRTLAQDTEDLANTNPLQLVKTLEGDGNMFYDSVTIQEGDADLSVALLNINVDDIPAVEFAADLNGKTYYGGDPLIPDIIYHSDFGNPERVDTVTNRIVLPENAGSILTGLVSAFGAIWAFKPDRIWRIIQVGGNSHQIDSLWNVGAVDSKSIVVFTDPDTGRTFIFFWSQHGPYLFDGANLQYIGASIEEQRNDTIPISEISWLSAASVVSLLDSRNREIICFHKPKISDPADPSSFIVLDRAGEAMVYNFRYRSWYKYTGLDAENALSITRTVDAREAGVTSSKRQAVIKTNTSYHPILGFNGRIYQWGEDLRDGQSGSDPTNPHIITAYASGTHVVTIDSTNWDNVDISGLWVTIISAITGDWIVAPILKNAVSGDLASMEIELSAKWVDRGSFIPAKGDAIHLFKAPASIKFPWDDLSIIGRANTPFIDKEVKKLITWHDGDFKMRIASNYKETNYIKGSVGGIWTDLADGDSQRKRTNINALLEAIKLELVSFDLNARLDAYAYQVHYKGDGVTPQ